MSHDQVVVDETNVYLTSGAPLPKDVDIILDLLLNHSFQTACEKVTSLCTTKGYALADVLQDLALKLVNMELDAAPLGRLLDGMSNVEHRLASGTDEKIQTASLVGVFVQTRQMLEMK
jgi:replication factor C subunit 3/5